MDWWLAACFTVAVAGGVLIGIGVGHDSDPENNCDQVRQYAVSQAVTVGHYTLDQARELVPTC